MFKKHPTLSRVMQIAFSLEAMHSEERVNVQEFGSNTSLQGRSITDHEEDLEGGREAMLPLQEDGSYP